MTKKFWMIVSFFLVLIIGVTLVLFFYSGNKKQSSKNGVQLVAVNEVEKLIEEGRTEEATQKLAELSNNLSQKSSENDKDTSILLVGAISCVILILACIYVFVTVLHPINKMKKYTSEIAKGNFDTPLEMDRGSEVGEFSWAIDNMRKELKKSQLAETEAIENNKTVIATLSHDIKTPIASIRAYAEGLGANLDSTPEKRAMYVDVIMKKSDEVTKVTDDLLLHSLSDMRMLKVEPKEMEISAFAKEAITDLDPEGKDIKFSSPDFEAVVMADRDRLLQCVENLINNARKYAKAPIEVSLLEEKENVLIQVKDHGDGIPNEDLPFIFDKFYRGHNHGSLPGSGLGLYIVKYLMEQMYGDVKLQNQKDGLLAILILPKKVPIESKR
ncbi:MAG: HAMP domain-containing histidine kinase [Clostridiales bacterium]|nr:HAMP domain-containing histidine kinase [Clostridiales bacterium]